MELHPVQANILKVLLFKKHARFSELNATKMQTDHFTFHVKRLVEIGFIEKTEDDTYTLTIEGKHIAGRLDTDTVQIEKQAKLSARMICVKEENGIKKYLLQQRLKQPYYGEIGTLGGKIRWGEEVLEAGARELKEESGLEGDMKIAGIYHKMDYDENGNFLDDKYFFIIKVENLKGKLIEEVEGGKNLWLTKEETITNPNVFPNIPEFISIIEQEEVSFYEHKYKTSKY